MSTVNYSVFLDDLKLLTGIDSFSSTELGLLKSGLNRRCRIAYRKSRLWPTFLKEELRFAGLDNVIPRKQSGKDEIGTLIGGHVWSGDPRSGHGADYRYQVITRSDGFKVLGLADVDETSPDFIVNSNRVAESPAFRGTSTPVAISFWFKGNFSDWILDNRNENILIGTVYNQTSSTPLGALVLLDNDLDGVEDVFNFRSNYLNNGGNVVWYLDGELVSNNPFTLATDYLDNEWHCLCATSPGISNDFSWDDLGDYWSKNIDATSNFSLEIADIRVYSEKLTASQVDLLHENPKQLVDGSYHIWGNKTPQYWVTYQKAMTGTYGDGTGETAEIPDEFYEYAVQGCYADWLRAEGQTSKAIAEEGFADSYLKDSLERVSAQKGSSILYNNIQTHGSRQSR